MYLCGWILNKKVEQYLDELDAMTELILKNRISKQKLDSIVYYLKTLNIDVEIKNSTPEKVVKKDPFAQTFGMWADRELPSPDGWENGLTSDEFLAEAKTMLRKKFDGRNKVS